MKSYRQIAAELAIELGNSRKHESIDSEYWHYYSCLSGQFKGDYYDVTIYHAKNGQKKLEVSFTTKNPIEIGIMLKKIAGDGELVQAQVKKIAYDTVTVEETTEL